MGKQNLRLDPYFAFVCLIVSAVTSAVCCINIVFETKLKKIKLDPNHGYIEFNSSQDMVNFKVYQKGERLFYPIFVEVLPEKYQKRESS